MADETRRRSQVTKDAIIQQHELLWKSVRNQRILLGDKEDLLYRLEHISDDIVANRNVTIHDLQQWDNQLAIIQEDLAIASMNYLRDGRRPWIVREITDILSKCYSYGFKFIIITALIVGVLAITWAVIWQIMIPLWVCGNIPLADSIFPFCKPQKFTPPSDSTSSSNLKNPLIKMPSVPTFVEKTTELAERLSNVDISAPNKLTEVKISLIDLKSRVSNSNIEQPAKQILTEKIAELRTSVESTTDNIHTMLAGFGGTLSKLEIYTRYALTYFTDESLTFTTSPSSSRDTALVITNFENRIQSQFEHYVENVEKQVNRIILIAEDVHSQLLDLDTKYETINDILSESHDATELQLKIIEQKILDEGLLVKLYRKTMGNGESDKLKHQHNLEILKEFRNTVKLGIIDVNNVIDRLKRFKFEAAELKSTVTEIELAQTMSLNVHTDILKSGIERLNQLKQRLEGRMKIEQVHHLDDDG